MVPFSHIKVKNAINTDLLLSNLNSLPGFVTEILFIFGD